MTVSAFNMTNEDAAGIGSVAAGKSGSPMVTDVALDGVSAYFKVSPFDPETQTFTVAPTEAARMACALSGSALTAATRTLKLKVFYEGQREPTLCSVVVNAKYTAFNVAPKLSPATVTLDKAIPGGIALVNVTVPDYPNFAFAANPVTLYKAATGEELFDLAAADLAVAADGNALLFAADYEKTAAKSYVMYVGVPGCAKRTKLTVKVTDGTPATRLKAAKGTIDLALTNTFTTTLAPTAKEDALYGPVNGLVLGLNAGETRCVKAPSGVQTDGSDARLPLVRFSDGMVVFTAQDDTPTGKYTYEVYAKTAHGMKLKKAAFTLTVADKAPTIKLSASTVFINTGKDAQSDMAMTGLTDILQYGYYNEADSLATVVVTPPKGGSADDLEVIVVPNGIVCVCMHRPLAAKGNYTVKFTPVYQKSSNGAVRQAKQAVTLTVKTTTAAPSIKAKASGTINLQDRANTFVEYTLTRANTSMAITNATLDSEFFEMRDGYTMLPNGDMKVRVYAKQGVLWEKCAKTPLSLKVKLSDMSGARVEKTLTLSITPKEYAVKAVFKAAPTAGCAVYQTVTGGSVVVGTLSDQLTVPKGVDPAIGQGYTISKAKLTKEQQDAFDVTRDPATGVVTVTLKDGAQLKAGTYKLQLLAQPAGSSQKGGAAFTVTVVIKK